MNISALDETEVSKAPFDGSAPNWSVRRVQADDLSALVDLCDEHARFEGSDYSSAGKERRLHMALFEGTPRLNAWIAVCRAEVAGYATASAEYATWTGEEHLHMDCLYVRPGFRNSGMGAALLSAVVQYAKDRGYRELQWQTPEWNSDACRFYRRHGGRGELKVRFRLEPAAPHLC